MKKIKNGIMLQVMMVNILDKSMQQQETWMERVFSYGIMV